jgi:hypothetical protein
MYYGGSQVTEQNPLPCSFGGDSVTITGDITIPGDVKVSNGSNGPLLVNVVQSTQLPLATGSNTVGAVSIRLRRFGGIGL